mmetsp:Transcript_17632/g.62057  ORF Transcript_17632/g.62057 Transcript_17632/m.62057 type:complete len:244 (+) Transcript_17632:5076-5807(+)
MGGPAARRARLPGLGSRECPCGHARHDARARHGRGRGRRDHVLDRLRRRRQVRDPGRQGQRDGHAEGRRGGRAELRGHLLVHARRARHGSGWPLRGDEAHHRHRRRVRVPGAHRRSARARDARGDGGGAGGRRQAGRHGADERPVRPGCGRQERPRPGGVLLHHHRRQLQVHAGQHQRPERRDRGHSRRLGPRQRALRHRRPHGRPVADVGRHRPDHARQPGPDRVHVPQLLHAQRQGVRQHA